MSLRPKPWTLTILQRTQKTSKRVFQPLYHLFERCFQTCLNPDLKRNHNHTLPLQPQQMERLDKPRACLQQLHISSHPQEKPPRPKHHRHFRDAFILRPLRRDQEGFQACRRAGMSTSTDAERQIYARTSSRDGPLSTCVGLSVISS